MWLQAEIGSVLIQPQNATSHFLKIVLNERIQIETVQVFQQLNNFWFKTLKNTYMINQEKVAANRPAYIRSVY